MFCVYTEVMNKWASAPENLAPGFANNKNADQPVHPHSLVSAFVIRFLESSMPTLATNEISMFYLVSVVEQTVLSLT